LGEANDKNLSFSVGRGGGGKKAKLKSRVDDGDEGVTIMGGIGDFSAMSGKDKSNGAGTST